MPRLSAATATTRSGSRSRPRPGRSGRGSPRARQAFGATRRAPVRRSSARVANSSVMVRAGWPKNGASSPSPPFGRWSGRMPTTRPSRSAAEQQAHAGGLRAHGLGAERAARGVQQRLRVRASLRRRYRIVERRERREIQVQQLPRRRGAAPRRARRGPARARALEVLEPAHLADRRERARARHAPHASRARARCVPVSASVAAHERARCAASSAGSTSSTLRRATVASRVPQQREHAPREPRRARAATTAAGARRAIAAAVRRTRRLCRLRRRAHCNLVDGVDLPVYTCRRSAEADDRADPARHAGARRGRRRERSARSARACSRSSPSSRATTRSARADARAAARLPRVRRRRGPHEPLAGRRRAAGCCWSRSSRSRPTRRRACGRASPRRRRPSAAGAGSIAWSSCARAAHATVETGRFGAHMVVSLVNDGPVTFRLEVP